MLPDPAGTPGIGLGEYDAVATEAATSGAAPQATQRAPSFDDVYGCLKVAGCNVALPLVTLREVIPSPEEFATLPVSSDSLLGAIELRGLIMPILDLRPMLGQPTQRSGQEVVVVITDGQHALGLLADEPQRLTQVAQTSMKRVSQDSGCLLSHTFVDELSGDIVSLLDIGSLFGLAQFPTVEEKSVVHVSQTQVARSASPAAKKYILLRCQDHFMALDVAYTHTTVPAMAVLPSVIASDLCVGVAAYDSLHIPRIDPLVLLGFRNDLADASNTSGPGLVLKINDGFVMVAVSELLNISELETSAILALPSFALPRPDLITGVVPLAGVGDCFVLNGAALIADSALVSLAAVNTAADEAAEESGVKAITAGSGSAYLTYAAGVEMATTLDKINEILPIPATLTVTHDDQALLGVLAIQSMMVPVLCLRSILGMQRVPTSAKSCLLVVDADGELVAFVVDALHDIHPLTWRDEHKKVVDFGTLAPEMALRRSPLVRVGDVDRMVPDLDLKALAVAIIRSRSGYAEYGAEYTTELTDGGELFTESPTELLDDGAVAA